MTITQQTSSRPDFREQAKMKDVPVARLIGFEAEKIGEGRAAVVLTVGPQHANRLRDGVRVDVPRLQELQHPLRAQIRRGRYPKAETHAWVRRSGATQRASHKSRP